MSHYSDHLNEDGDMPRRTDPPKKAVVTVVGDMFNAEQWAAFMQGLSQGLHDLGVPTTVSLFIDGAARTLTSHIDALLKEINDARTA